MTILNVLYVTAAAFSLGASVGFLIVGNWSWAVAFFFSLPWILLAWCAGRERLAFRQKKFVIMRIIQSGTCRLCKKSRDESRPNMDRGDAYA